MAEVEEIQEKVSEGSDEEQDLGSNEPQMDLSFLGETPPKPKGPTRAEAIARRAAVAGEKVGGAARSALSGIGERLGEGREPTLTEDDISDLFEGPDMEADNDVYTDDLLSVEEEDVFGEGGEDMSDILEVPDEVTEVPEEEVIGDLTQPAGQAPMRKPVHRSVRPTPPTGITGLQ